MVLIKALIRLMRTSFPALIPNPLPLALAWGHYIQLTGNLALYTVSQLIWLVVTSHKNTVVLLFSHPHCFPLVGMRYQFVCHPAVGDVCVCVLGTGTHGPSWTVKIRGLGHITSSVKSPKHGVLKCYHL